MIRAAAFTILSFLLISCRQSVIQKTISGSDSLIITFNQPNSNEAIKTVETTERSAIRKLVKFVDGKEAEKFNCGYDGNMIFYKDGDEILPVVFKYREKDCEHFLFEVEGKVLSTRMSGEAIDFLKSLEEGRAWY